MHINPRIFIVAFATFATAALGWSQQLSSLTLSPNPVNGGASFTGKVTLNKAAGTSGLKITLASSAPSIATVPTSVTVASGATTASFTGKAASVSADTSAKITATDPSNHSDSVTLDVNLPTVRVSSLSISPTAVFPEQTAIGTVTLTAAAPSSGFAVKLSSGNLAAGVPSAVTVKAGAKTATFEVFTRPVTSDVSATITATDVDGYKATAKVEVDLPSVRITGLEITPSTVTAANSAKATLTLSASAPTGGFVIKLTTAQTYIGIPATVTVPAGADTATFTVQTLPVSTAGTATVTGIDKYGYSSAADLTVNVPTVHLTGFTISPASVTGGSTAKGTLTVSANAPTGGFAITLSTMQSFVQVPMTATVAAGSKTATFTIKTSSVSSTSVATITASDVNDYVLSAKLMVTPPATIISMTSSLTFSPQSVTAPAGSIITWSNAAVMEHTATSDVSGQGINSGAVAPGNTYSWTIPTNAASGTKFFYHCQFHGSAGNGHSLGSGMAGVITVK
jgi:plastocyanin